MVSRTLFIAIVALTQPAFALPAHAEGPLRRATPPAGAGASAPQLTAGKDGVWLSWLEADGPSAKAMRVALLNGGRWSTPATVARGAELLSNWADVPGVVETSDGALYAQWLVGYHGGYGVEMARSSDSAKTWTRLGPLHSDRGPSEHGFVSFAPTGSGLLAFWLDGRATPKAGATELRMKRLDDRPSPTSTTEETVIDERVCDCCQTAAVPSGDGALVVYRDRSPEEIRDISIVRIAPGKASASAKVHSDGWKILGCPVNGPAIAAAGQTVVVAWFTAANDRARVEAARSTDGGLSFGPAWTVDEASPFGRVSVAVGPDGAAAISWLGRALQGDGAELRVRRFAADGRGGSPMGLVPLASGRAGGTPRMVRSGDRLVFAWVEKGSIAVATLAWADLPRPSTGSPLASAAGPPRHRALGIEAIRIHGGRSRSMRRSTGQPATWAPDR